MNGTNLARNPVTVKAGQSQQLNVGGSFIWCEDSGGQAFTLKIANRNTVACKEGINLSTDTQFNTLTVINDLAGADITVILWTGTKGIGYNPKSITAVQQNAATYTKATGILTLADGASSATYNGVDAGKIRKLIVVSNHSANSIYAQDGAAGTGVLIPTQQSIVLETGGSVIVKNVAGSGPSNYSVLEIFYS